MKDHADNLIPLLEFKPYFQEVMHQEAIGDPQTEADQEIQNLKSDVATMSQMLSRN